MYHQTFLVSVWFTLLISAPCDSHDASRSEVCHREESVDMSSSDHRGEYFQAIQRVEWSSEALVTAAAKSEPVLFINAPSVSWKCGEWTPTALAKRMRLAEVQTKWKQCDINSTSLRPVGTSFWYHNDDMPMARDADYAALYHVPMEKEFREGMFPAERFFAAVGSTEYGCWHAGGPVEKMLTKDLIQEIGDPKIFMDAFQHEGVNDEADVTAAQEVEMNVWFGGSLARTAMHYDTSENVHVAIYGTKRFVLASPDTTGHRQFPSLHPYYRHYKHCAEREATTGRCRLFANNENWPAASMSDFITVDVAPGEALYIPAYWFHEVSAAPPSAAGAVADGSSDSTIAINV
eukprot:m.31982 g.31982  ORF g.31982 m.31982 type:complete len:348 (-) comp14071_c0_seq1:588-1631(-)